jgi:Na+/H+-dicarboxylate symporter
VNLAGNCLATAVVARWEGEFPPKKPAAPRPQGETAR